MTTDKPKVGLTDRGMNIYHYGNFMLQWHSFECVIETAIKNHLRLSNVNAHIVLGSLGFQAKANILKSLLFKRGQPDDDAASKLISSIALNASRNALIHGIVWFSEGTVESVKRDISKNKLVSKYKRFVSQKDFHLHVMALADDTIKLQQLLHVSSRAVRNYRESADKFIKSD